MKIKKVDDKPMVIHTKEKAKIHAHEPKGAKIKGSNIYTVERGPKVHDAKANEMDKKASANTKQSDTTSVADEISKLLKLKEQGILTEEEFNAQKAKLLK